MSGLEYLVLRIGVQIETTRDREEDGSFACRWVKYAAQLRSHIESEENAAPRRGRSMSAAGGGAR